MHRWLVAGIGLLVLLAGYAYAFGNPPPASATDKQGWKESRSSDSYGLVTVHKRSYESPGTAFGGALVATAGDWPGIPESVAVPRILDNVAKEQGMTLTERGTDEVVLQGLGGVAVEGTVYDVQKKGTVGSSRAIVVDFACPAGPGYVVGVGYGSLGSNIVSPTYDKARKVLASVTCG